MRAITMGGDFIGCEWNADSSADSSADDGADYEGDFETVARFLEPTAAHIVASCLQAAGIETLIADANLVQTNALWAIAAGGVRILVPAIRAVEARQVLAAFERGDFALADEDDPGP
jgi:hypothetical protein